MYVCALEEFIILKFTLLDMEYDLNWKLEVFILF